MRRTKYHASYGYVTVGGGRPRASSTKGKGIGDFFRGIQPFVTPAVKKAASKIATAGMKVAGDKIGNKIADRIAPKAKLPQVSREDILRGLRLDDSTKDLASPTALPMDSLAKMGFGRKKKIRGSGLRVLT